MAAIRILLGITCFAIIGSSLVPERDLLGQDVLRIAGAEIGVREATGNNDGKRIKQYLAAVGLPKGQPYCAAFISWVFKTAGYPLPRTGWSPALFPAKRIVKTAKPGNLFGIYFPTLKRIAHCGFVESTRNQWVTTIEGNTNLKGNREGDGVHRRTRHARTIHRYADWTTTKTN